LELRKFSLQIGILEAYWGKDNAIAQNHHINPPLWLKNGTLNIYQGGKRLPKCTYWARTRSISSGTITRNKKWFIYFRKRIIGSLSLKTRKFKKKFFKWLKELVN
jgi:hypothetical protein